MSMGEMPPEVAAALQQAAPGAGGAPAAPVKATVDLVEVQQECLRAALNAAKQAITDPDARDVREQGQAALAFAQAYVTLDPTLVSPQGVPPEVLAAAQPVQPSTSPEGGSDAVEAS